MFGISLISTKKLNHLTSECSKLAIANVELSKQNATQAKTIIRLSRIFPVKLLLQIITDTFIQKNFRI